MDPEVVAACADDEVVAKDLLKISSWEELKDILVRAAGAKSIFHAEPWSCT